MWHRGLLRRTLSIKKDARSCEWTPEVSIPHILYCFSHYLAMNVCTSKQKKRKKTKRSALRPCSATRRNAAIITMVFPLTTENREALHSYVKCSYPWYFRLCRTIWNVNGSCVQRTDTSQKKRKTGSLRLIKSFQIQTVDILLAERLQCSAEAEQAPVDNHLLCGGKQGEMEQMALVLFCCGCFLWIRNALLNAKLCGRGKQIEALLHRAPRKGMVYCVCSNFQSDGRVLLTH